MANDLNQCSFIGRLGKDPDIRYMPSGDAIATFSIGCGSQWKDKSGEKQESTEWVSITAFGKLGEICGEYLKKGSQVFVSGRMKTDKYEKDGVTRYSTKIVAEKMQMLGGKSDSSKPRDESEYTTTAAKPTQTKPAYDPNTPFDDDVPFN